MNDRFTELGKESGLLFSREKLSYEERKFAELLIRDLVQSYKPNSPSMVSCPCGDWASFRLRSLMRYNLSTNE